MNLYYTCDKSVITTFYIPTENLMEKVDLWSFFISQIFSVTVECNFLTRMYENEKTRDLARVFLHRVEKFLFPHDVEKHDN